MAKLSAEELAELKALEQEEKDRLDEVALAAQRQHLEALRLVKKLRTAGKNGEPGSGFVVIETRVGNVAVRRPTDVEIDSFAEEESSRGSLEAFAQCIVLEPPAADLKVLMADNPGLATAVMNAGVGLVKVLREEEAKK